jgi:hypothetical protein
MVMSGHQYLIYDSDGVIHQIMENDVESIFTTTDSLESDDGCLSAA